MMLVLIWSVPAHAWENAQDLINCLDPSTPFFYPWRFESGSFTAAERNAIRTGFEEWHAGSYGDPIFDTFFMTYEYSSVSTASITNGRNEVYERGDGWFWSHFLPPSSATAVTFCDLVFPPGHSDIVFVSSNMDTCLEFPGDGACIGNNTKGSLPHTAAHELGHAAFAFAHQNDVVNVMRNKPVSPPSSSFTGFESDLGRGETLIEEDNVAGLYTRLGTTPNGLVNFALSGWVQATYNQPVTEQWLFTAQTGFTFDLSQNNWVNGLAPDAIGANIMNSSGLPVTIHWYVGQGSGAYDACASGELVGTRRPTMGTNLPYYVGPSSWDFTSVAPSVSAYKLCALIDPNDEYNETREDDNRFQSSNAMITVQP